MLLGRQKEFAALDAQLQSVLDGQGKVVFLRAELGMGKSLLVREWCDAVQQRNRGEKNHLLFGRAACTTVPTAHADARALESLQPFAEVLQSLGMALADKNSSKSDVKRMLLKIAPKWLSVVPFVGEVIWAGMETYEIVQERRKVLEEVESNKASQQQIFQQYVSFLSDLSERKEVGGLIMFLDDFQWADAASINLLFFLARQISTKRIMVIASFRPEGTFADHAGAEHPLYTVYNELVRHGVAQSVVLPPVNIEWVHEFLDHEIPGYVRNDAFASWLCAITGGNPGFIKNYLEVLRGENFISADGDVKPSYRDIGVPDQIVEILEDRLRRLDESTRKLLRYVSVEGEEFSSTTASLLTELPLLSVLQSLRRAEEASMVERIDDRAVNTDAPVTRFRFTHTLFSRVMYDSLSEQERRILHQTCFETLRKELKTYDAMDADEVTRLLRHGMRSGEFVAVAKLEFSAARKAWHAFDETTALHHIARAADCIERVRAKQPAMLEPIHHQQLVPELLQLQAEIHQHRGRFAKALAAYSEAMSEWALAQQPNNATDMRNEIAWIQWRLEQLEEATQAAEESLAEARGNSYARGEALAHRVLGLVARDRGQMHHAREQFEHGATLLRASGDSLYLTKLLVDISTADELIGDIQNANENLQQAIAMCDATDDRISRAKALTSLAGLVAADHEYDRALEYLERVLSTFEAVRDPSRQAFTISNIAAIELRRGRFEEANDFFRQSLAMFDAIEDSVNQARALRKLGVIWLAQSDVEKARECMHSSYLISEVLQDRRGMAEALHYLGELSQQEGMLAEARDRYEACATIYSELGDARLIAAAGVYLGEAYLALGARDAAMTQFEKILQIRGAEGCDDRWEADALDRIGDLWSQAGMLDVARDFHEASLEVRRRSNDFAGEAETLVNLGRIHRTLEQYSAAETMLSECLALARDGNLPHSEAAAHKELLQLMESIGDTKRSEEHSREAQRVLDAPRRIQLSRWELRSPERLVTMR